MYPDGEAPLLATYEVRVVVGHAQIVDRLLFASIVDFLHRYPLPVGAAQQVPRPQCTRRQPAPASDPVRVLCRRTDHPPADMQMDDPPSPDKHRLDTLDFDQALRIMFG